MTHVQKPKPAELLTPKARSNMAPRTRPLTPPVTRSKPVSWQYQRANGRVRSLSRIPWERAHVGARSARCTPRLNTPTTIVA